MDAKWTAYAFATLFSSTALAVDSADFQSLDTNNDGYVTKDDVSDNSAISNDWDNLDLNDDDRLDRAEFARFETMDSGSGTTEGVPNNPPGTEGYDSPAGASGTDAPSGQLGAEPGSTAQ